MISDAETLTNPVPHLRAVDLFAGGGGASHGIERAVGVSPLVAVDHDPDAIQMHTENHPDTVHLCQDVYEVRPFRPGGESINLLWASPDCTGHSRARGGKPRDSDSRGLAWAALPWLARTRPGVFMLENVPAWLDWGPLCPAGHPIPERKGETFRAFCAELETLGYRCEWRSLRACDYGAPTSRERLFFIARCDNKPIVWPEPTHGPGRPLPYRMAGECLDFTDLGQSIFERKRPLAEAVCRRIARVTHRFLLTDPSPFLLAPQDDGVWAEFIVPRGYGERAGQLPRICDIREPLGTIVTTGKHALVSVWLAKQRPGVTGHADRVSTFLAKYYGQGLGQSPRDPLLPLPTKSRFGLVTVELDHLGSGYSGTYVLSDILFRMLTPRELARAQGFQDEYILTGTQKAQKARIGNSAPPHVVEALVRAQFPHASVPAG